MKCKDCCYWTYDSLGDDEFETCLYWFYAEKEINPPRILDDYPNDKNTEWNCPYFKEKE